MLWFFLLQAELMDLLLWKMLAQKLTGGLRELNEEKLKP